MLASIECRLSGAQWTAIHARSWAISLQEVLTRLSVVRLRSEVARKLLMIRLSRSLILMNKKVVCKALHKRNRVSVGFFAGVLNGCADNRPWRGVKNDRAE
jgi:hypothetical protein